jgi:hypothetical protein
MSLQVVKLDNATTSGQTGWTMTRVAQSMPMTTPLATPSALGLVFLITVILILPL